MASQELVIISPAFLLGYASLVSLIANVSQLSSFNETEM